MCNVSRFHWKALLLLCLFYFQQVVAVPSDFNWYQMDPDNSPSPRIGAALFFDGENLILFGGRITPSDSSNETWVWNGRNWRNITDDLQRSPSARSFAAVSMDSTGKVILFGGTNPPKNDTWRWNGVDRGWEELIPNDQPGSPDRRAAAMMALDPITNNVVLFGGTNRDVRAFNDTWLWDGVKWTQFLTSPSNTPPARAAGGLGLDRNGTIDRLILFGGSPLGLLPETIDAGNEALNDTWAWTQNGWVKLEPTDKPDPRYLFSMARDDASGQLLLFGGRNTSRTDVILFDDTWTWNGSTWLQLETQNSPGDRSNGAGFAYDADHEQMVLFGGGFNVSSDFNNRTWLWVPLPTVESVIPNSGPPEGGTEVTITGTNFLPSFVPSSSPVNVLFGLDGLATNVDVRSDTKIKATSPPGTLGDTVPVLVQTVVGTSVSSQGTFTYSLNPTVDNVSPNSGPLSGGTIVVITGTGFDATSSVAFGSQSATSFTVDSSTQITAIAPPSALAVPNTVYVIVTTSGRSSQPGVQNQFTYKNSDTKPTITLVSPNIGSVGGGTRVTITGYNFTNVEAVLFGENNGATSFQVISDTEIQAVSPPSPPFPPLSGGPGIVDIRVQTASEILSDITPQDQFQYVNGPIVTSVFPNSGPASGGTTVTITGINFSGLISVAFGSTPAKIISASDTSITVISPEGPANTTVDITVTTLIGTSDMSPNDEFHYQESSLVLSPLNLRGFQKATISFATAADLIACAKKKQHPCFLARLRLVNVLTWNANPEGNPAVAYQIYRRHDGRSRKLIGTVLADQKLKFKDKHIRPGVTYTYFVVAVDESGNTSEPATVKIKPFNRLH